MKRNIALFVMLIFGEFAAAQGRCPIVFSSLTVAPNSQNVNTIDVMYRNASNKNIRSVRFAIATIDAFGEVNESQAITFENAEVYAKPGEVKEEYRPGWPPPSLNSAGEFHLIKSKIWLQKLMFVDGSIWQDNGSHACSLTNR